MRADVVIIGAGPAGLAAAIAAKKGGASRVLVLDREARTGGILRQCIHSGFGLHSLGEELTGPEYASRYAAEAAQCGAEVWLNTMVLDISGNIVTAINPERGMSAIEAGAIVLAMGCRERSAGALMLPGERSAGVLTAGTAQRFVNIEGYMPGREVVILGSGDIGLIMARRMTLEGARVKMVLELMPYSGGLKRNIVQCLDDFGIPLYLSYTVTKLHGKKRLTGVSVAAVDGKGAIKPETDPVTGGPVVDAHLQTSVPGVFACGNAVQVHDLVDFVTEEAMRAGASAAVYAQNPCALAAAQYRTLAGCGVRYIVPQRVAGEDTALFFRSSGVYKNCATVAMCKGKVIARRKKQIVTPGEMERLDIKGADILGDITVSIEEARHGEA